MILALSVATLLDDGPFFVVAALAAATALVLCGGRRLMAAANDIGRYASPAVRRRPEIARPTLE